MNTEIEEQLWVVRSVDSSTESSKKPKKLYTRKFLLSLSELEVCKKLPDGFDESLLSEFDDALYGIQDRQQVLGSSSAQGFRRTEYVPAPAREDSDNYSRGFHRWESRSSGRSDTDSDSESGRRYSSQARRSWKNPEHDGLLGSGSFPRPSGSSVPRFRPNDSFHVGKSNEPYHPPRPYKAVPHSRRETNDSYNGETFGSTECASDDRVEEENKRRAEFEIIRREQRKALQDKLKLNSGKLEDPFSELVENPSNGKISSDLDKVAKQAQQDSSGKLPVSSQAPPSRPLVPPGFVSGISDKSSLAKSLGHANPLEVGKFEQEYNHQDMKTIAQERGTSELQCETTSPSVFQAEKGLDLSSVDQAGDEVKASSLPYVSEVLENGEIMGLDSEFTGYKILADHGRSTSILEELFGNPSTASGGSTSNFIREDHDAKTNDDWSPNTLQSKFARWFLEEDKKHQSDMSSEKSNDLLSLIVGGEKDRSDVMTMAPILSLEIMTRDMTSNSTSSTVEISEHFSITNIPEPNPAILTCEDLEQSILAEIGEKSSHYETPGQEHYVLDVKVGHPGTNVDNLASQHLLSLLQKGMGSTDDQGFPNKPCDHEVGQIDKIDGNISNGSREGLNISGKTLTLEALFGTAFMKELHSAHRDPISGDIHFPSAINENGIGMGRHSGSILASNDDITKFDKVGNWLAFHGTGKDVELSKLPDEVDKFGVFGVGYEVQLPEEDSLISLSDPCSSKSDFLSLSSNVPVNVVGKDERSMIEGKDHLFLHNERPLLHALNPHPPHIDPHLQFMPPEAITHRNASRNHQFAANMGLPLFPHPSVGRPEFDHPIHPTILQQMHLAGNLPPPHLMRGFPGGTLGPAHPGHTSAGYIQEHSPMQGFPFGQRQPNVGAPVVVPPGAEVGDANNPPEAFRRLLEMELRAKPKQMHPFAAGDHSRAMYGHELDMGFRYG